ERQLQLAHLRPLTACREQSQHLESRDRRRRERVAGGALDRGLPQARPLALETRGQRRRLAGERIRVDREVDVPHAPDGTPPERTELELIRKLSVTPRCCR